MDYEKYMDMALEQAHIAFENNEVPIGCVIVYKDNIIGKGANMRVTKGNVLAHAEIMAINEACAFMGDWRLEDCTLFVTVEPCPMCAGAILQARIKEVVFGTENPKAGCVGSVCNILEKEGFNHKVIVSKGIKKAECAELMKAFFKGFRQKGALRNIPGVGKNMEQHLKSLGINTIEDLKGKDPEKLYLQECQMKGENIDRCVLYVYRLAVYCAENEVWEKEKLKWWYWKDKK